MARRRKSKRELLETAYRGVRQALDECRHGSLPCRVCGTEETMHDLDLVHDLREAFRALMTLRILAMRARAPRSGRGR